MKPSPVDARIATPARADLVDRLRRANASASVLLVAEAAITLLVFGFGIVFSALSDRPGVALVAVGAAAGGTFVAHLQQIFLKKKRVVELSPATTLGPYNRQSLLDLVAETLRRVGTSQDAPTVFITRDKEPNAHALRVALLPLPVFDGIFINRAILHLLERDELASVIGHELGHARGYGYIWHRFHLVHVALSVAVALSIVSRVPESGQSLFYLLFVLWGIGFLQALPGRGLHQTLELLCDDLGARVAGVPAAIKAELKLGAEAEVRFRLTHLALELGEGHVAPKDALSLYNEALPFGPVDPDGTAKEIERRLSERVNAGRELSLGGFLTYAYGSNEAPDELKAQQRLARVIVQMPRIQLPPLTQLDEPTLSALETALTANPERLLFQLPAELDDSGDSHPSPRRRILYLLRNRHAIERAKLGA